MEPRDRAASLAAPAAASLAPPVLLCVDDELLLLEVLETSLRMGFAGFDVVACVSGGDALEAILRLKEESRELALVLSDEVMPGMSGTDLLEATAGVYPDAARVILTGQAGLHSAIQSVRLGIDDYLEKPFKAEALVRTLRGHLDQWTLRRENSRLKARLRAALARTSQLVERALGPVESSLGALLLGDTEVPQAVELRRARREMVGLTLLARLSVEDAASVAHDWEYMPLGDLVSRTMDAVGASGRDVSRVERVEAGGRPVAFVQPIAARLALQELVDNALSHSPAGSPVEMGVLGPGDKTAPWGAEPPTAVDLHLRRGGAAIAISNRAELSRERQEAITRVLAGDPRLPVAGFGLSFAAWAMELMRGSVWFQGRPGGHAATFWVGLPPARR